MQVIYAKLTLNNWGLGKGKYLWVHWDEVWVGGMRVSSLAKMCEALGLKKGKLMARHKSHIPQVMYIGFIAYAFEDNPENGGKCLKLGVYRCQAAKINQKTQMETRHGEDGTITYPPPEKGGKVKLVI